MIPPGGFSIVSDDPIYQRIKQRLLNSPSEELEGILNEFGPRAFRRKRNSLLVGAVTSTIPFLGLTAAFVFDNAELREATNNLLIYAFGTTIINLPLVGYGLLSGIRNKKRDQYALIAADAILSERREHYQFF